MFGDFPRPIAIVNTPQAHAGSLTLTMCQRSTEGLEMPIKLFDEHSYRFLKSTKSIIAIQTYAFYIL